MWQQCLEDAIQKMNDMGVECYTYWRNLQRWHQKFVVRMGTFVKAPGKNTCLPQYFLENPDAQEAFKQHGIKCLKELKVELMHEYVNGTMVPAMMNSKGLSIVSGSGSNNEIDGANDGQEISVDTKMEYLKSYGLSKLTIQTVAHWMHAVGFRYTSRGKHYFVDGHKKEGPLEYRKVYTKRYLDLELRSPRCDTNHSIGSKGVGRCW